ncbi:hypothetical protein Scep_015751 [Stephania cephalantha]|uniref:BHLH domain-containing protein n=1 Tax=Stephania cephalantha TaxID=152367 RepID=A0AAP0J4J7_9MAGN
MRIDQVRSSICALGRSEAQIMHTYDSSISIWGREFFQDSQVSNDRFLGRFAPLSAIEVPHTLNYLNVPGLMAGPSASLQEDSTSPSVFPIAPSTELAAKHHVRKRKIRSDEKGETDNNNIYEWEQWSKKKAVHAELGSPPCRSNDQEHGSELQEKRAPVKRSLKIGDKITALQKLVSPFGKTNTASVLHEASVYIKYLQEQIQMLSTPYLSMRNIHSQGDPRSNEGLRRRGLCLVPVSFTQNLANKDHTDEFE